MAIGIRLFVRVTQLCQRIFGTCITVKSILEYVKCKVLPVLPVDDLKFEKEEKKTKTVTILQIHLNYKMK